MRFVFSDFWTMCCPSLSVLLFWVCELSPSEQVDHVNVWAPIHKVEPVVFLLVSNGGTLQASGCVA